MLLNNLVFINAKWIINSPVNIKLSKTQLSTMIQSGGFLGRLLGSLF